MPLVPTALASSLENDWLVKPNGSYPDSVSVSADRFATAFSNWFAGAIAGPGAVTTAGARKAQLAMLAIPALSAQAAQAAGSQLATAIAAYITGQMFGAGVAGAPIAVSAAGSQIGAVFADLDSPLSARAQQIAAACQILAVSTIVTFPPPLPPAPVT
jgi:hypothetical protein